MSETRKIAAILVADVVGYSRLAGADEDRTLSRLRGLRSDLIDPAIAAHQGRIVKRTGDGSLIEFRSVVDAVRCAIEVQSGLIERNAGVPGERRIEFRVGIHLGDVVEEADGDLMGDGVNIAARLESICAPGAICLSEDAYRQVKGRLDLAVTDLGPTQLKNIAEPVRIYSLEVGKASQAKPPPRSKRRSSLAPLGLGFAALMVLVAAGVWYFLGANRTAPVATSAPAPATSNAAAPAHLSIVVLPFTNLSGDASQDYFADGVTENLTTELSRIRNSFVIARNTAFTYKDKAIDAKQIGRELGVRYVLEGSVQRDQNRVRVNAQLIDAESGAHLWADRFDKPLADLFNMQDEIVARLAGALNTELVSAEARRAEQAANSDSMDLYFQGVAWFNRGYTPDNLAQSRSFFDRALSADPNNVDALVWSARTDTLSGAFLFVTDPAAAFVAAEAKLTKALSSVPDHARAHMYLGLVDIFTKRAAEGIAECEYALALDRNLANAHSIIGLGEILPVVPMKQRRTLPRRCASVPAIRWLMPGWVWRARRSSNSAVGSKRSRGFDGRSTATEIFPKCISSWRPPSRIFVVDEAHSAVEAGFALNPAFTVSRARTLWTAMSDDPTYLAQLEPIFEGLRKAGVPEQ